MPVEPCGEGEHLWVQVRKRGCNTDWVARQLAQHTGVAPKAVSYAGKKDRHAVAEQWFSIQTPTMLSPGEVCPGVEVIAAQRHRRKLRRGAHEGNAFVITLTEVVGDRALADERLTEIQAQGVPNYFGEQRFGHQQRNIDARERPVRR